MIQILISWAHCEVSLTAVLYGLRDGNFHKPGSLILRLLILCVASLWKKWSRFVKITVQDSLMKFHRWAQLIKMCGMCKNENSCSIRFLVICPMIALIIDFIIMQSLLEERNSKKSLISEKSCRPPFYFVNSQQQLLCMRNLMSVLSTVRYILLLNQLMAGVWFDFCFTALQHILGHFGRDQLT